MNNPNKVLLSGDGGGGGGGGGYNIPISVSRAETLSANPNQNAATVMNIGSVGDASGGSVSQRNDPYMPATAVSSASQRDAQSSLGGVIGGNKGSELPLGLTKEAWIAIAIAGVLTVGVAYYFATRSKYKVT